MLKKSAASSGYKLVHSYILNRLRLLCQILVLHREFSTGSDERDLFLHGRADGATYCSVVGAAAGNFSAISSDSPHIHPYQLITMHPQGQEKKTKTKQLKLQCCCTPSETSSSSATHAWASIQLTDKGWIIMEIVDLYQEVDDRTCE
jgi:hypothetical protein